MNRRVAITGIGAITPIGNCIADCVTSLTHGRSAIALHDMNPGDVAPIPLAAVTDYQSSDRFSEKELLLLDRATQFALVATSEAMASSQVMVRHAPDRVGAIIGSGTGGGSTAEENYAAIYRDGKSRPHPMCVPKLMINASASHITIRYGITGPSFVVASACASSAHAIGTAFHMIRAGIIDAAVTGGTEACLSRGQVRAWEGLRIMSTDTCRPFSLNRRGIVLGEGAAILIIEDFEAARRAGTEIYGELLGVGMNSDAGHIVQPGVAGCATAISACLASARLTPDCIQYVNAHGTGTRANDIAEVAALQQVFGGHLDAMMVSSTKAAHGHCIGAAAAIELCVSLASLRAGIVPATVNFETADPECRIDCVANLPREAHVTNFISNSFAFGGHNACLAVRVERAGHERV